MCHQRRFTWALTLFVFFIVLQASALRADTASAVPPDQLGKVNFPTSCRAEVQPAIEKGVALLHSFQYKESEQTFADAATKEPKCAMAHWGKAMARFLFHSLMPTNPIWLRTRKRPSPSSNRCFSSIRTIRV